MKCSKCKSEVNITVNQYYVPAELVPKYKTNCLNILVCKQCLDDVTKRTGEKNA